MHLQDVIKQLRARGLRRRRAPMLLYSQYDPEPVRTQHSTRVLRFSVVGQESVLVDAWAHEDGYDIHIVTVAGDAVVGQRSLFSLSAEAAEAALVRAAVPYPV